MRKITGRLLAALLGASAIVAAGAVPASAQPAPNPEINVFEVEAHTLYCQHGGSGCVRHPGGISQLRFADATVFRFSPLPRGGMFGRDNAVGTPEVVHAVCAHHYRDAAGHVHARAIDFTGTTLSIPGVPKATVRGKALVLGGRESSKHAFGAVAVTATAANGDRARIIGAQVADNTNDSHVSGGFFITVKGMVVDTDFATGKSTLVGPGEMSCSTDIVPVTAPFPGPAPNVFSAEVNDIGDPS
jgi:hypothetical protein